MTFCNLKFNGGRGAVSAAHPQGMGVLLERSDKSMVDKSRVESEAQRKTRRVQVASVIKVQRKSAALGQLHEAMAICTRAGVTLKQCSPTHFQAEFSDDAQLNIWPTTYNLMWTHGRASSSFDIGCVKRPWTLLDVAVAIAGAISGVSPITKRSALKILIEHATASRCDLMSSAQRSELCEAVKATFHDAYGRQCGADDLAGLQ